MPPGVYRNAKIGQFVQANGLTCARALHELFGDVVHKPSASADAMCIGFVAPKAHWLYPHWGHKQWGKLRVKAGHAKSLTGLGFQPCTGRRGCSRRRTERNCCSAARGR